MPYETVTEKKRPVRATIALEEKLLVGRDEAAEMLSISRRALDYTAIVDGAAHPLRVIPKGRSYFQFDERYLKRLTDDGFGFHRPAKDGFVVWTIPSPFPR